MDKLTISPIVPVDIQKSNSCYNVIHFTHTLSFREKLAILFASRGEIRLGMTEFSISKLNECAKQRSANLFDGLREYTDKHYEILHKMIEADE